MKRDEGRENPTEDGNEPVPRSDEAENVRATQRALLSSRWHTPPHCAIRRQRIESFQ